MKKRRGMAAVVAAASALTVAPLAHAASPTCGPSVCGYTYYVPGTRQPQDGAVPPVGEPEVLTGLKPDDPRLVVVVYPRDFFPVVGRLTLDQSSDIAAQKLKAAGLTEVDTVVAVSQGAYAAEKVRRDTDTGATYRTYGDPTNADGGLATRFGRITEVIGVTPLVADDQDPDYKVTYVREYDIIADAPDNANPVSWVNAVMGGVYLHSDYRPEHFDGEEGVDVVTTQRGPNSWHVLSKTEKLPLVQPLRDIGVDERAVQSLEKPLRKVVDQGYTGDRGNGSSRDDKREGVESTNDKADEPDAKPRTRTSEQEAA